MINVETIRQNHPIIIGSLSALSICIVIYSLGYLRGYEAKILIEESLDNFSMLCNTIILACATILALLLNALGSSRASKANIKEKHYKGLIFLTSIVTFTFIGALFSFLLVLIPITETDKISPSYYKILYWVMLIDSSILVGSTISIALMLRNVIINITMVTGLKDTNHEILESDEDEVLND